MSDTEIQNYDWCWNFRLSKGSDREQWRFRCSCRFLRKKGLAKAAKKADRLASESY